MWIAFKNYYLRDTTQQLIHFGFSLSSCELLSKIIIFVTRHNLFEVFEEANLVVNCFQKLLSSWHDTTIWSLSIWCRQLWIAFKNYYLRDTTQRWYPIPLQNIRCELLSKIIIFVTRHNKGLHFKQIKNVVNCFQKLLSSWHDTTLGCFEQGRTQLWIAFKNYYLRDTTQHYDITWNGSPSCELLSKIIIFVTRHNRQLWLHWGRKVVNCFQKLLSSWHDTTLLYGFQSGERLWIAFKNYYLRDTTQHRGNS